MARNNLIMTLFYFNYLRVKYLVNYNLKSSIDEFDLWINTTIINNNKCPSVII